MATTTLKEQFPEDIGDGSLVVDAYPGSDYVTLVGKQKPQDGGAQRVYLIVSKQELIDALNKED
jgi:hypothetical protein